MPRTDGVKDIGVSCRITPAVAVEEGRRLEQKDGWICAGSRARLALTFAVLQTAISG